MKFFVKALRSGQTKYINFKLKDTHLNNKKIILQKVCMLISDDLDICKVENLKKKIYTNAPYS
jgi:hypothetical protein